MTAMSKPNKTLEDWEQWFRDHRSDEIAVLVIESIRILLRKGEMTAEDIHHIPVKNPSIRGSLMKQLRRMGIAEKDAFVCGTTKQSKAHTMAVWKLKDSLRAQQILKRCASILLPLEPEKREQMPLL
jgi:transcription initiation factor IIE alpha subunit